MIKQPWGQNKPSFGWQPSPSEVAALSLTNAWLFNESGGLLAFDCVGNNIGKGADSGTSPVFGNGRTSGSAAQFDETGTGTNGKYAITGVVIASPFSCSFWLRPNGQVSDFGTVADNTATTAGIWYRGSGGAKAGKISVFDGQDLRPTFSSGTIADAQWSHVVCTFPTNLTANIYFNGALDTSLTTTITGLSGTYTNIGNDSASESLKGSLECLMFCNRVLTPDDVLRLYTEPFYWMQQPRRRSVNSQAATTQQQQLTLMGVGG